MVHDGRGEEAAADRLRERSRSPERRPARRFLTRLRQALDERYLDLLCSIYIYNEHRGYTAIDRVLEAVRARAPDDVAFIAAIEKHRADERKHYLMFRRWFEARGRMPLLVDRTCGHIDRFVEIMFGSTIDQLDTGAMIARDRLFERLCRVVSLTEQRGHRQVCILLDHPIVRRDRTLVKIFAIIERDEPSRWQPYDDWLHRSAKREPSRWERAVDTFIHSELLFVKLPLLFVTPRLSRRDRWADDQDPVSMVSGELEFDPVAHGRCASLT